MQTLREFFKSWREDRRRRRKAARPFRGPWVIGAAAAVATMIFHDEADPDALNLGLATLITVNAVVVGLSYATLQRVLSLTAKTDERASYRHGRRGHGHQLLVGHPGRNRASGLEPCQRDPAAVRRLWPS